MKIVTTLMAVLLSFTLSQLNAQPEKSRGFKKAILILADGSSLTGLVKDNIRKNASVVFTDSGGVKKNYDGSALLSVEIDAIRFVCINGDFFKVLCDGELSFLQKSSDASGKPSYNGHETIFSSGTTGKPGDYFIYNGRDKRLKLVSTKNIREVAAANFAGYTPAIDRANAVKDDLSQLKEAVEAYNNRAK